MIERKCFCCGGFGHIVHNCRNRKKEGLIQRSSNKFEIFARRVIDKIILNVREQEKDRKTILQEKRLKKKKKEKKKKLIKVRKVTEEKSLSEIIVKISLERIDMEERIMMEALLDSEVTVLMISSEFARKKGFKLKTLRGQYM